MSDDPETILIDGIWYVTLRQYAAREIELLRKLEAMWKMEAFVKQKLKGKTRESFPPGSLVR